MSYSLKVKSELMEISYESSCCMLSELSAIVHTAGSLNISREGLYAEINTENETLIKRISQMFQKLFGIRAEIISEEKKVLKKHTLYTLYSPKNSSEQILNELGIISFDENHNRQINRGIDSNLILQDCCCAAYLRGAFLSCGNITVPLSGDNKKISIGYHLEFVLSCCEMAEGIEALLNRFNIISKQTTRKDNYIVYIKESEGICDFLALLKASKAVLELQNIKVEREVKNNTNRQTNCIVANIDKTVDAAIKQIEAINAIEKSGGLDMLPPKLRKVAKLRQEYPDVSLETIADLTGENLTKSGINHRMRKIIKIAQEL